MQPTREIYGNIVGGELVYVFMVISFGLVAGRCTDTTAYGCRGVRTTVGKISGNG